MAIHYSKRQLSLMEPSKREVVRAEMDAEIQEAFQRVEKKHQEARDEKRRKRKTVGELLELLDVDDIMHRAIRPPEGYLSRTYNLERQLHGLVSHLFLDYPIPKFLFQACLRTAPRPTEKNPNPIDPYRFGFMKGLYRDWLITLGQGGSFPKAVRGIMTSKESAAFLRAPNDLEYIHEAVWWAKMTVLGIPLELRPILLTKVLSSRFFDDPGNRLAEFLNFILRTHPEMDRTTLTEVLDFTHWKLGQDRDFRFRGRTTGSVVNLANRWQMEMVKAKLGRFVEWPGLEIPTWVLPESHEREWEILELRNNRELVNEGRKQKHCVYGYTQSCLQGRCSIFSLRHHSLAMAGYDSEGLPLMHRCQELARSTIEVRTGEVVQFRGPQNAKPPDTHYRVLHQWAGEKGLIIRRRWL